MSHVRWTICEMTHHLPLRKKELIIGLLLGLVSTLVYVLTLEPTVSFWDCGEFIATSYKLQIGHPPGAPLYQLIAHAFCWLAGNDLSRVAYCCNLLSALAGGFTVMFLYWTICEITRNRQELSNHSFLQQCAAVAGSMCYLFCDTAWFSAVESEVYSLAMLFCSIIIWAMVRWYRCEDRAFAPRWLILSSFLLGLGVCVHFLVLLTVPFAALTIIFKKGKHLSPIKTGSLMALFFIIGLTPYLIIPIRANANPPINCGNPSDLQGLKAYLGREQYEKAPLYPRMWRHRAGDDANAMEWSGGDTTWAGNLRYYATYQLGFMYGRYICNNFIARKTKDHGNTVWFIIPIILAIIGMSEMMRDNKRMFWVVLALFLTSGPLLNLYLNHPCYEPRERDYAYVLSFYALSIWIGVGGISTLRHLKQKKTAATASLLIFCAPLLMAIGNWNDHDRSGRYLAYDSAINLLNSCDQGALLFTWGDNDTFPIWYVQQVEEKRTDIQMENINLIGYRKFFQLMEENIDRRPCYFSQYAYDQLKDYLMGQAQLEGMAYRISLDNEEKVNVEAFERHLREGIFWHDTSDIYIDPIGRSFLQQYEAAYQKYRLALSSKTTDNPYPNSAQNAPTTLE